MNIEAIIFYILVIDSIAANLFVQFDGKWYTKHFRVFSRMFPLTAGWALLYLVLVIWIGTLLVRLGAI